jgi:hypothetical protein
MSRRGKRRKVRRPPRLKGVAAAGALSDPLDGCLVECGGDLYFAVDFTSGGLPIGLRVQRLDNGDLRFPDLDGDADDFTVENEHYLAPADPYRGRFRPA